MEPERILQLLTCQFRLNFNLNMRVPIETIFVPSARGRGGGGVFQTKVVDIVSIQWVPLEKSV